MNNYQFIPNNKNITTADDPFIIIKRCLLTGKICIPITDCISFNSTSNNICVYENTEYIKKSSEWLG